MSTAAHSPAYTKLLGELKAILAPFSFCPTCSGILKTIEGGNLWAVGNAVNVAFRERLIPSRTLRMAIRAWAEDFNAAGGE